LLNLIKIINEEYLELKYHATKSDVKEAELKLTKDTKETKFIMLKGQFIFWITQMSAIIAIFYKLFK